MIGLLRRAVVIPVLTIERATDAVPLAKALVAGGLDVLEVTLRTPAALEAIRLIAGEAPGAIVGAGTVLVRADLDRAAEAGAAFAVSPGLTPAMLAPHDLPLLPGVATASELMSGLDAGLTAFKLFPAVPMGGVTILKAWAGPFPQAVFCPTGGVDAENAAELLALANVACVGGAWVAPRVLIDAGRWSDITGLARRAAALGEPRAH
ncbi:MAG: bifunctional 4-hydroxy-2-oxoglutarate aldolase/2-dehydro-3-deoxy-phosphogluconate aldolase [Pseudomonadota bacterium]